MCFQCGEVKSIYEQVWPFARRVLTELEARQGGTKILSLMAHLLCMTQSTWSREDQGLVYPIIGIVLLFWLAWVCRSEDDESFTLLRHVGEGGPMRGITMGL